MSQAIPTQHPAVVLRSHFALVRALLVASLIAVLGLTTALVVVANDGNEASVQHSAEALGAIRYGGFNPATGRPEAAPMPKADSAPLTRYDGGPEEGTRGAIAPAVQPQTQAPGTRYDGGPEEGSQDIGRAAPAPESRSGPGFRTD